MGDGRVLSLQGGRVVDKASIGFSWPWRERQPRLLGLLGLLPWAPRRCDRNRSHRAGSSRRSRRNRRSRRSRRRSDGGSRRRSVGSRRRSRVRPAAWRPDPFWSPRPGPGPNSPPPPSPPAQESASEKFYWLGFSWTIELNDFSLGYA